MEGQHCDNEKVLIIPNNVSVFKDLEGKAVVGRMVSLDMLVSLKKLLAVSGTTYSSIHYIGGLSILLNFDNDTTAGNFVCNHDLWKDWFSQLDVWQGQSLPYERIAWLKVFGVPLNIAVEDVFSMIGKKFGKVVHVAGLNREYDDLSVNRIGVLIGDGMIISGDLSLV
ncbi:hypothetical protein HanPI659440_Chr08g0309531 [Helianthus annuus]|nr:hypothetical protein HanPI659440_Chr08g0309531 [Helianthus annuus]